MLIAGGFYFRPHLSSASPYLCSNDINQLKSMNIMLKSEVFEKVLQEVVAQTEISRERILSQETCVEVVDARHILIYIMHTLGFYPRQIAELMNCTPANVRKALGLFRDRVSSNNIMQQHLDVISCRIFRDPV